MQNVTVLLSTYNGEEYLTKQLDSLEKQNNVNVKIKIRDDGSKDRTKEIIQLYMKKYNNIELFESTNIGPIKSFMQLLLAPDEADYFAFCDQDDIWVPDKLSNAISKMERFKHLGIPILYYSEACIVDENLEIIKKSTDYGAPYSFGQILVKNHVPGCTMVFNRVLKEMAFDMPYRYYNYMPFHDHWIYILCRMYGGKVLYEPKAQVLYRQHINNTIGDRNLLKTFIQSGFFDSLRIRSQRARLLLKYGNVTDIRNKKILETLRDYPQTLGNRIRFLFNKDVKPSSILERAIFDILILLGRV